MKTYLKTIISLVSFSLASLLGRSDSLMDSAFPVDALPAIAVKTLSDIEYLLQESIQQPQEYSYEDKQEFDAMLQLLTELLSDEHFEVVLEYRGLDVRRDLILIAFDRSHNLDRYNELIIRYGNAPDGLKVPQIIPVPPPVSPEHIAEQYELVWKYLLIAPTFPEKAFMDNATSSTILGVLSKAPAGYNCRGSLRYAFTKKCEMLDEELTDDLMNRKVHNLISVWLLSPSRSNLADLLWARDKLMKVDSECLDDLGIDVRINNVMSSSTLNRHERWLKVLEAVDFGSLRPDQRNFLLAAFPELKKN